MKTKYKRNRIMKTCNVCKESKSLGEFHYDKCQPDNRRRRCKECVAEYDHNRKQTLISRDPTSYYKGQYKRTLSYMANSPRKALYSQLYAALKRVPTVNPVTVDELVDLFNKQQGKCALTGIELVWAGRHKDRENLGLTRHNSMSIDRINQHEGYSLGNVRLVCSCVNSFRGRMSDDEMYKYAEALLSRRASDL